ncbi:MAG: carboxypeptidase-like regulatory domain-containing protein, partial [Acidobacteriota bacterium]
IPVRVAAHDVLREPADIWSALDNELRPALSLLITLALNPYQAFTGPLVKTRELRFGQAKELPLYETLDEEAAQDLFWMVGGQLQSEKPLENPQLKLVERGQSVTVHEGGRFVVGNLEAGKYTLELSAEGLKPTRHKITVPSKSYDIKVKQNGS